VTLPGLLGAGKRRSAPRKEVEDAASMHADWRAQALRPLCSLGLR